MDRQRPGRQKARPRCRQSEKESSILRICLESIGAAEDTLKFRHLFPCLVLVTSSVELRARISLTPPSNYKIIILLEAELRSCASNPRSKRNDSEKYEHETAHVYTISRLLHEYVSTRQVKLLSFE
jgi:hypothetical protein